MKRSGEVLVAVHGMMLQATCEPILHGFDWDACPVGYIALAVLCSQILLNTRLEPRLHLEWSPACYLDP